MEIEFLVHFALHTKLVVAENVGHTVDLSLTIPPVGGPAAQRCKHLPNAVCAVQGLHFLHGCLWSHRTARAHDADVSARGANAVPWIHQNTALGRAAALFLRSSCENLYPTSKTTPCRPCLVCSGHSSADPASLDMATKTLLVPECRPPYLGDLLTMAINDVLNGMILQVRANPKIFWLFCRSTLQETITYPLQKVELESMIFHFPMVGYVSSLDATFLFWETKSIKLQPLKPPERFSIARPKSTETVKRGFDPSFVRIFVFQGRQEHLKVFSCREKTSGLFLSFFGECFFLQFVLLVGRESLS